MTDQLDVKELRDRTGAGILDCKEALEETDGIEEAVEYLEKKGKELAEELSGRTAADGMVHVIDDGEEATFVEVNCETDFVAQESMFRIAVISLTSALHKQEAESIDIIAEQPISVGDDTVRAEEVEEILASHYSENIEVRRIQRVTSGPHEYLETYTHSNDKIATAVVLDDNELARDLAMHVAAMNPLYVSPEDIPEETVEERREVYAAQMREKGKPEDIIPQIVDGKVEKWMNENTLVNQPFVKDEDSTVGELLDGPVWFLRWEVGEGIEEEDTNFAEEVEEALE